MRRSPEMASATSSVVSNALPSPSTDSMTASAASSSIRPPSASRPRSRRARERGAVERLETEEGGAAEQRPVHLEERVLGRGADKGERAVFDTGEKRVLLRLTEAVHFVQEQDRRRAVLRQPAAARSATSRTSLTPALTALSDSKAAPTASARSRAIWSCRARPALRE